MTNHGQQSLSSLKQQIVALSSALHASSAETPKDFLEISKELAGALVVFARRTLASILGYYLPEALVLKEGVSTIVSVKSDSQATAQTIEGEIIPLSLKEGDVVRFRGSALDRWAPKGEIDANLGTQISLRARLTSHTVPHSETLTMVLVRGGIEATRKFKVLIEPHEVALKLHKALSGKVAEGVQVIIRENESCKLTVAYLNPKAGDGVWIVAVLAEVTRPSLRDMEVGISVTDVSSPVTDEFSLRSRLSHVSVFGMALPISDSQASNGKLSMKLTFGTWVQKWVLIPFDLQIPEGS